MKNYIYVGMTKNLDDRIKRHNSGGVKSTRAYRPFILIHSEGVFATRQEARDREKYWKSGVGKEKLKAIKEKTQLPK